ncbi:MAG: pseudouridine synthase [Paracoccaceae bacterium]|nr:pseudouridine synthase [Paracoccaceae bacterium]MDE2912243.1 pseudouridine synthase [Paracoccaceae bacterium]
MSPAPVAGDAYRPPDVPLAIVHADAQLLVADKPCGLLSVPGKGPERADCLAARVQAVFPEALVVHRLDRDTSGLMVFALTPTAQRHLGLQFEKRQVTKVYMARVRGRMVSRSGTVNLPLIVDWPNRPRQMVSHDHGRPAQTEWQVQSLQDGATRVRLMPKTGRSHQLRVHMLAIGHPILGDPLYGDDRVAAAADRLQLHAMTLKLRHPDGGRWMTFRSPPPF